MFFRTPTLLLALALPALSSARIEKRQREEAAPFGGTMPAGFPAPSGGWQLPSAWSGMPWPTGMPHWRGWGHGNGHHGGSWSPVPPPATSGAHSGSASAPPSSSSSKMATSVRSKPTSESTSAKASSSSKAPTKPSSSKGAPPSSKAKPTSSTSSTASSTSSASSGSPTGSSSSSSSLTSFDEKALKGHNTFRKTWSAEPLQWNATLADAAQEWANKCNWSHSGGAVGPYGENLAAGYADVVAAMGGWEGEASSYNASNPAASHFTQMVWKGTTDLGCAVASCDLTAQLPGFQNPAKLFVCEYWPAGNVYPVSNFATNVGPKAS